MLKVREVWSREVYFPNHVLFLVMTVFYMLQAPPQLSPDSPSISYFLSNLFAKNKRMSVFCQLKKYHAVQPSCLSLTMCIHFSVLLQNKTTSVSTIEYNTSKVMKNFKLMY